MKHLLLLTLLSVTTTAFAQIYSYADLDINNYKARFYSNGKISSDGSMAHFAIPKDSNTHGLFSGSLYIGAFDQQFGVMHLSYMKYDNTETNFRFGPIASSYGPNYLTKYDRVCKVSKSEIVNHIQHYSDAGYLLPASIAYWPANGDVNNGEPAQLAPYADLNNNGIYEPANGEYPVIKGDQALYIIFSDRTNLNNIRLGTPLNVDIHMMVYGFGNTYSTTLQNTLFVSYKVVNRSQYDYRDMLIGLFNDFDLGNFGNDRVGCDTSSNSFYVYNSSLPDFDAQGVRGYGYINSSLGVTLMNQGLYSFIYETNGAVFAQTDPDNSITPQRTYNFMNATWADATPITVGGSGYGGTIPTHYAFPSHSCTYNTTEWSDYNSGMVAGDRRALGSAGKFNLPTGSSLCLDIAYVYSTSSISYDSNSCTMNVIDTLLNDISYVRSFYNYNLNTCMDLVSGINETSDEQFNTYPNPVNDNLRLSFTNQKNRIVTIYDMQGRLLKEIKTGDVQLDISMSELSNSSYVVLVSDQQGIVSRKLIIKQ